MINIIRSAFLLILFNTLTYSQDPLSPWERANPDIYRLEQKINSLEKVSESLYQLHEQLKNNNQAVLELNRKAGENLRNNIYKIYMKGSLEVYNKIASPLGSVLDLANDVFMNLAAEPALWKTADQKAYLDRLNNASYYRNTKLRLMFVTLGALMSYDSKRFDDDLEPIAYTKQWWGAPDGKNDDEIETLTRKTNLIIKLSDFIYIKTEEELGKLRDERRETIALIDASGKELAVMKAQDAERRKILKETEEWIEKARKNIGISPDRERYQIQQTTQWDSPEIKQKVEQTRIELNKFREMEKAKMDELERMKKIREQKEADARVYIDAECPRHVLANERIPMIVRAYPEDIKGTFVLYVDDKEVGRTKKESNSAEMGYLFASPGKYDIQVKLLIRGKYNDTYTDQFYAEENPAQIIPPEAITEAPSDKSSYDPKLEGTKKLKMDLGFCKYYTLYEGGKIYLDGYYYTPSQQKVNYRSEPIAPETEPIAEKGLMITKSGTGYHFYQTIGGSGSGIPYIITRMRGTEVKVLNRFNAVWMRVVPKADFSSISIEYTEKKDGPLKTITLD